MKNWIGRLRRLFEPPWDHPFDAATEVSGTDPRLLDYLSGLPAWDAARLVAAATGAPLLHVLLWRLRGHTGLLAMLWLAEVQGTSRFVPAGVDGWSAEREVRVVTTSLIAGMSLELVYDAGRRGLPLRIVVGRWAFVPGRLDPVDGQPIAELLQDSRLGTRIDQDRLAETTCLVGLLRHALEDPRQVAALRKELVRRGLADLLSRFLEARAPQLITWLLLGGQLLLAAGEEYLDLVDVPGATSPSDRVRVYLDGSFEELPPRIEW